MLKTKKFNFITIKFDFNICLNSAVLRYIKLKLVFNKSLCLFLSHIITIRKYFYYVWFASLKLIEEGSKQETYALSYLDSSIRNYTCDNADSNFSNAIRFSASCNYNQFSRNFILFADF